MKCKNDFKSWLRGPTPLLLDDVAAHHTSGMPSEARRGGARRVPLGVSSLTFRRDALIRKAASPALRHLPREGKRRQRDASDTVGRIQQKLSHSAMSPGTGGVCETGIIYTPRPPSCFWADRVYSRPPDRASDAASVRAAWGRATYCARVIAR